MAQTYQLQSKKRTSFSDEIGRSDSELLRRIVDKIFSNSIKDYGDFEEAFDSYWGEDTSLSNNAGVDFEDKKIIFESDYFREKMGQNLTKKEMDNLYGDGQEINRYATKRKVITLPPIKKPKKVSSYKRRVGKLKTLKEISAYNKSEYRRWGNAEKLFVKAHKQKGVSKTQTIKEFQLHFRKNERTRSSIESQYYRTR